MSSGSLSARPAGRLFCSQANVYPAPSEVGLCFVEILALPDRQ
jgi:hypothetical protein